MIVTARSVDALDTDYPGIRIAVQHPDRSRRLLSRLLAKAGMQREPTVLAIHVVVSGIRGGGSRAPVDYELLLDVTELHSRLPAAWILEPSDVDIRHVNIFNATSGDALCPWLDASLPNVCWFRFADAWSAAPPHHRTLSAALEFLKQLLNTENHDSPAR